MIDLNKEEYVYLMTVHTQSKERSTLDYEVIPFKSMNDIEKALLNIIANNIKNHRNDIANINYDSVSNIDMLAYAKIEYKNGISKLYHAVRRKVHEVK